MARPRRRRFSHDYEVRQRRARAEGYKSDYDRRMHDHGRIPPSEPPLKTPAARARARGHERQRLEAALEPGAIVFVSDTTRGKDGRYTRVVVTVNDANGVEHEFVLRGTAITAARLDSLADRVEGAGAVLSPSKSLNVRQLASDVERRDDNDEEPEE